MVRRTSLTTCVIGLLILAFSTAPQTSTPIKLTRHPDYHTSKIAFSYLGDIWTANENKTTTHRLTDNRSRDIYPHFSPDNQWIAFSSNRYSNNNIFIVAAEGSTPRQLTFHNGNDEIIKWTRDSQNVLFRAAHGDDAFPNVATLYQIAVDSGQEQPLPIDQNY